MLRLDVWTVLILLSKVCGCFFCVHGDWCGVHRQTYHVLPAGWLIVCSPSIGGLPSATHILRTIPALTSCVCRTKTSICTFSCPFPQVLASSICAVHFSLLLVPDFHLCTSILRRMYRSIPFLFSPLPFEGPFHGSPFSWKWTCVALDPRWFLEPPPKVPSRSSTTRRKDRKRPSVVRRPPNK